jgi:glycerophosphoryl diester phosphodiesterase
VISIKESISAPGPLNFAHRGFTRQAPENSMAAFEAALALGVDGIELDVRLCGSGEVVVFHDAHLSRMTNGSGLVRNKTLAELRTLRLSLPGGLSEEKIPTLSEVAALVHGKLLLNVEIKSNGGGRSRLERKILSVLAEHDLRQACIVSSFNPMVLRRMRKLDREIAIGLLVEKNIMLPNAELLLLRFVGANGLHLSSALVREKLLEKMRRSDIFSFIWTVNDRDAMQSLVDLAIDGIITDRPDLLSNLKQERLSG